MYDLLFQRGPSRAEVRLARQFLSQSSGSDVEPLAQLGLALINLNEFLFVD